MAFSFTLPQQQQQTPLFQTQTHQRSPFQQNTSPFFQQQQQQPQQTPLQQQQQQFLQQQQQSQPFLFTNDKAPATYSTKWADLHPDSQKLLLQIEERILEYRDESQRLDQCGRLYDSSVSNDAFELDASHILQELGGISTSMDRQKTLLKELMTTVKDMLRNTEIAVRSFMMLHPRFIHPNKNGSSNTVTISQASGGTGTTNSQQTATAMVPVFDFYSGLPRKPSPFLQQTVARFDKYLGECRQWIEELEQLLLLDSNRNSLNSSSSLLQSLPKVMLNVHDFFVHVAAKVESIHQYMESMKTAYLADQRRRGDGNDPFVEADRRETAKQAAAARRVHPILHLPANSQPSAQVSGLFANSGTAGTSTAPPTSGSAPAASSGSGSPFFATPPAVTSASSLFSTPITPAPVMGGGAPQQSIFGSFSTSTPTLNAAPLFGSTPTPTLNTAPLFGSTPATGASSFSTPFATGAATGSGASFGTLSKARAKSRTSRR